MFALAFESVFDFIFGILLIYGAYRLIFHKTLVREAELKQNKIAATKLAIVKLHSTDSQDIEDFLNKNAQFLPKETVEELASHLDTVRIINDEPLKKRFATLEKDYSNSEHLFVPDQTNSSFLQSEKQNNIDALSFSGIKKET